MSVLGMICILVGSLCISGVFGGPSEFQDVERQCLVGEWTITSGADLKANFSDLECIFWAGVAPIEPPLGALLANSIDVKHSPQLGKFLNQLWQGHVFTKTVCQNEMVVLDQASVQYGIRPSVGLVLPGPVDIPLKEGEYQDGGDVMNINYDVDFKNICPIEIDGSRQEFKQSITHQLFAPYVPINPPGAGIYFSIVRIVGRTTNSVILLEKFYTKSPEGYVSIGFVYFESQSPALLDQFPPNTSVVNPTEFNYLQTSGKEIFKIMIKEVPAEFLSLPFSHLSL